MLTRPDGAVLNANPEACRIFSMTEEEIIKSGRDGLVVKDDNLAEALREREQAGWARAEITFRRKDGTTFIGEVTSFLFLDAEGCTKTCMIIRDITDQKRTEEALKASESRYHDLYEGMTDAFVHVDMDGRIIEFNEVCRQILGYEADELRTLTYNEISSEIWRGFEAEIVQTQAFARGYTDIFEKEYRRKDGTTFPVESRAHLVRDLDGRPTGLWWIARDITERKNAEKALRESEERLCLTLDAANDGVWEWNLQTGEAVFSPHWYIMLGYEPYEFPQSYDSWRRFVHPCDLEWAEREINKHTVSSESYAVEVRMQSKAGGWPWILIRGRVVDWDEDGCPIRMMGTHSDITERKQAEEELRDSKALLEGVLDVIEDIIAVQLPDHSIQRYNRAGYEFLGLDLEDVFGRRCYELMGWQNKCYLCATSMALKSKKPEFIEKYIPELATYLDCRSYPILDERGEVKLIIEQLRDITAIKRAEELLKRSEQEKSAILNGIKDIIVEYVDPSLNIIWANKALDDYYGCNSDLIRGLHCYEVFLGFSEPCPWCLVRKVIQTGQFQEGEVTTPDGNTWIVRSNPIKDDLGQITGIVNILLNITDRKQAEEMLRASLHEKEVLLREIHHRVKNNLQIIHSLLSIQANRIHDETAREAIAECRNRVRSIALIHEWLYQSESLARVDFAQYISSLVRSLFSSFGVNRQQVTLNLDLDQVFLSIDKALPCSLIVNELVSNCLKHAFPDGRAGAVEIILKNIPRDRVLIAVRDDGIGLPEQIVPKEARTLGLRLVNDLAKQLRGEIRIDNRRGTVFEIVFPAGQSPCQNGS